MIHENYVGPPLLFKTWGFILQKIAKATARLYAQSLNGN